MIKLKLTSLLLIIATFLALAACTPKNPDTDAGNATEQATASESVTEALPETSPEDAEKTVTLYDNGQWQYRIVTRAVRNTGEKDFSFGLSSTFSKLTGSAPHTANDTAIKGEDAFEIIIGNTAHSVMRSLYSTLGYGDACIKVVGSKILVAAYTQEGFAVLFSHVEALIKKSYSDNAISLKVGELEALVTVNEEMNELPTSADATYIDYYNCGLGQTMLVLSAEDVNAFDNYIKNFDASSCVSTVYDSGNAFATFDIGSDLINVSFAKNDKKLRIIKNKDTEPTSLLAQPADLKKVCEPLLIMHGLGWEESRPNGICILIRLSDGRFIIVDGGFNRQKDADDLYGLLKENTPDGMEPTVAAWFITHGHSDHHGTFATFFRARYSNTVKVESVMFNPPKTSFFQEGQIIPWNPRSMRAF